MSYASSFRALSPYVYWRMGDSASPLADDIAANDLIIFGSASYAQPGALDLDDDGAIGFDGINAAAHAALNLSDAAVITFVTYLKWTTYGTDDHLLAEFTPNWTLTPGSFIVDMNNSTGGAETDTISVGISGGSGNYRVTFPRAAIPAGEWHHLALVLGAAGTIKVYVDGVAVTTTVRDGSATGSTAFANSTLNLMCRNGESLNGVGVLDETGIVKRELTAGEIAALVGASSGGNTLYVNADHVDADDAGDYAAAQDPDTPLVSIMRAAELAQPGDLIRVWPATNADPTNELDSGVYARVVDENFGGEILPGKDASAARLTIEGVTVAEAQPKWLGITATGLKNWEVHGFQIGYDLGSGDEFLTNTTLIYPTDVYFHDNVYTGGGSNVLGFAGHNRWEHNTIVAGLRDLPNPNFLEGNGFRCITDDGSVEHVAGPDDWVEFVGNIFDGVEGEDAIQLVLANGFGSALVEGNSFGNVNQSGAAHTDAVQSTGCTTLIVRGNNFGVIGPVDSQLICSDAQIGRLEVENNLFQGSPTSGFSMQVSGVISALIRHNTFALSRFAGLRFFANNNLPDDYDFEIHSNLIDKFQVDIPSSGAGVTWSQHDNVIGVGPITGADHRGFAEYGTSDLGGPNEVTFELANADGLNSPGIDQGDPDDLDPILLDRLGRAREGAAPDCGCHESSLSRIVTAGPRSPYLIAFTPSGGTTGVAVNTNVSVELFPKPGETINESSVSTDSFYVQDADGYPLPVRDLTVSAPDGDGYQTITLDIDGALFPRVAFTTTITTAIEDSEGSALASGDSVTWRTVGPAGPAVSEDTGPGSEMTLTEFYELMPDVEPRFRYHLTSAAHQLGELMAGGLPAAEGIVLVEASRQDIRDALDLSNQQANFESITGP